ncbi:putative transcription factor interactor and regulator CCHC(Zn) family protein [Tanacetum coccineum]
MLLLINEIYVNYVVVTWILNSLSPNLFVGAIYAKTAFEMWSDLKESYDKVDGSVVFNMHKSIDYLNQNGSTLAEYYNNLNSLWKQFDATISLPHCTCECHFTRDVTSVGATKPDATAFAAKTFDSKRRFNNNFNKGLNFNSNNKGPNPNLKCTNGDKVGHIVDRCFQLVGYPAGYIKRNFNVNTILVSRNNASIDVHSNNATTDTRTSNSFGLSF